MSLTPEFLQLQRTLLGRYSLERELGRGGMGIVYLARDIRLDRPVAIKVMHAHLAADADARESFLREARTAAGLAHPNIIQIISVESRDEMALLVMAAVDGETLGSRIRRRGPLPPDDVERLVRELAWALGYAHAHGIIHRDLTLENVLLERDTGRALLVDFGLAGGQYEAGSNTRFGTPGYLAPEVIRGEGASPASDLYALGAVAWTALVGRGPFEAESTNQLLAKHLVQPTPSLAPVARGASRRLIGAIEACLAKLPDDRPIDTAALLTLLERAPEPVVVAPALRTWFTRWERIRPVYALATPILALQTKLLIWASLAFESEALLIAGLVSSVLSITLIPIAVHFGFEVNALRQLQRAGFGIADIRAAYSHWRETLIQNRRKEGLPALPGRVVFDLTAVGSVVLFATFFLWWPNLARIYGPGEVGYVRGTILQLASSVYLATLTGIGIGFASPGFRLAPAGRFRRLVERFWNSSLAAGLVRVAGVGQQSRLTASSTLHRNTELVLGLAIDDLWAAFPAPLRTGLGDVPALAHTLQGSATAMRQLIDGLRASEEKLSAHGDDIAELITTRHALEARLSETVAALETLRLQMLRTVATREQSSALTQQLDAARMLEDTLLREIAGHAEVRQMLGKGRSLRPHPRSTPTPSPA